MVFWLWWQYKVSFLRNYFVESKVHFIFIFSVSSVQSFSCVRLFATPMNRSTPGLVVHHQLSEFTQTHASSSQ